MLSGLDACSRRLSEFGACSRRLSELDACRWTPPDAFGIRRFPCPLPLCPDSSGIQHPAACLLLSHSLKSIMSAPLHILVVEDEKALAHMIAMVLGGPASKVTRARNGWEALIRIGVASRPFDVVITDHRMPRMNGLQLVRRLRAKNFGGKILVLSAYLSDEDIAAYEELRVDMMMSKPFDFDELQQAMAVLNKKASVLAGAA
jgi:CheY-like chemotaxis protein